ncbi:MAG: methylmalonyl-CoA epimerase, partial [Bacteroidota bacterium]
IIMENESMLKGINHIGIAVKDLDASIEIFKKIFNFEDIHREKVDQQKVEVGSFKVGEVLIELTSPTAQDSPIAKFIEKRGEGIHHIAFESDGIDSELERLSAEGIKLINEQPVPGAHDMLISFLHPKSTNSVLMEICQPKK